MFVKIRNFECWTQQMYLKQIAKDRNKKANELNGWIFWQLPPMPKNNNQDLKKNMQIHAHLLSMV